MSESTNTPNAGESNTDSSAAGTTGGNGAGGNESQQANDEQRTFSQEDVNRIVQDRLDRERKRFEGFDDFKAAAERVPDLESKNKELTEKVAGFEFDNLVSKVADDFKVPAAALRGKTEDELKAHAEVLKQMNPAGSVIPAQHKTPGKIPESEDMRAVRSLFGS